MGVPGMPGGLRRDRRDIAARPAPVQTQNAFRGSTPAMHENDCGVGFRRRRALRDHRLMACGPVAAGADCPAGCKGLMGTPGDTISRSQQIYYPILANEAGAGNGLTNVVNRLHVRTFPGSSMQYNRARFFLGVLLLALFTRPHAVWAEVSTVQQWDQTELTFTSERRARESLRRYQFVRRFLQRRRADHSSARVLGWRKNVASPLCAADEPGTMELAQHLLGFGGRGAQ